MGRLAFVTPSVAISIGVLLGAATARAEPITVPAAHVVVTLEHDGVLDVLEQVQVHATAPYAAGREISMQQGELFADPSVFVNDSPLRAGDGKTPGTFRVSRGARGIRFAWRQPAGKGSVRLGYRLALLGTAYTDVVDLRVPVWEGDWPVGVHRLTAALELPRKAHGRVFAWVEPESLDATITKTHRDVRLRMADVPDATAVKLHVVFPRGVLRSVAGLNVKKKDALASILAERSGGDKRAWWPWALGAAGVLAVSGVVLRTARSRRPRLH